MIAPAPGQGLPSRRVAAVVLRSLRAVLGLWILALLPMLTGCSTAGLLLSAAGVATDTSIPWAIAKHIHAQITEGDPVSCWALNSVQRAVSGRCGAFVPGSLQVADVRQPSLVTCPLALAARDPKLWPVLGELVEKGAQPEACARTPLVELALAHPCPEFETASPEVLRSIEWLAQADARAIDHDVMRLLSCPQARIAGLDQVLDRWLAQGDLEPGRLAFSPLGALHPAHLATPLARALEARGHTAQTALGSYAGALPSGFELALRGSHWQALDWWLTRLPELANQVPPAQGNQLAWLPLQRVLVPSFLEQPVDQAEMVAFLMARGASPWRKLPFDPGRSVVAHAREIGSPMLALLEAPPRQKTIPVTVLADSAARERVPERVGR